MKYFQVFAISLTTLILAACSGGGGNRLDSRQCPSNYDPVEEVDSAAKMSLDQSLPNGTYVYQNAIFHYKDAGGFEIEVVEAKPERSSLFKSDTRCVRGARGDLPDQKVQTPGISKFVIEAGKDPILETKQFGFQIKESRIQPLVSLGNTTDQKIPSKVYEGTADEVFMVNIAPQLYDVRSKKINPDGSSIELSIRFVLVP
ncbi:MAG TPA: hypothetical protein PKC28_08720 [Bdellovibrionales bacterium]|nr:hypothetical protein [Bdellovibrionales bacterium]